MNRIQRICLSLFLALTAFQLQAQLTSNQLMPPPVDMTKNGWNVSLQNGNLTFGLPVAAVPGEVPVPVAFGLNATYLQTAWSTRVLDYGHVYTTVWSEVDRPMVGGVHLGYISSPSNYGGTTVEGLTVLENGAQIADSQWKAFSYNPVLGTELNLPQAFGFVAVSTERAKGDYTTILAMVDPTANYLSYTTTASGLGPTYQAIIANQNLAPEGFGAATSNYKVVMDKSKARVYAFATSKNAWVPILWADRFGHYVTFKWVRSTAGLPAGITAITKVTAMNLWSKGVILRWADYSNTSLEADVLRVDYVGVCAPSVLIKGYPGYSINPPVNFVSPSGGDNQWTVVPSTIGSNCRPTSIQVGSFDSIAQPSWSNSGATAATAPVAPPPDGTSAAAVRTWLFTYDGCQAELNSITEPNGLTTNFYYANYLMTPSANKPFAFRGVTEVHAVDASSNKQYMRWSRSFPSGTTPMSVKLEGWWDPVKMPTPDRYHQIVFPTDSLAFGNGVYQTNSLMDTAGKTWSTTTYAYNPVGAGINGTLSSVQSITVQKDKTPTISTAYGYPNSSNLQVTQQNVSSINASGGAVLISTTTSTYAPRWDMLEGHQLSQVDATRFAPDGTTPLSTITRKNVYDTPASGPALLQLQKSYLDGGSVGKHGATFSYDSQGRFSAQGVYHVEGALVLPSPNTQSVGYDLLTGKMASSSLKDEVGPLTPTLTQPQGGFDSAGRATTRTDVGGVTTTYSFDDRGRVLSVSRPGSPVTSYAYPDELTFKVTIDGQTTTSSYDGFGRIQSKKVPSGISATTGDIVYTTLNPTYDQYSRQVAWTEVTPANSRRTQSVSYDALDRVISQTPVVGGITTTTYDVFGTLSKVTTTLSNQVATTIFINSLGQTVEVDAPDGSKTTATYDGAGHQVTLTITPAIGTPQTRQWFYDALGRLVYKIEPETNTQSFGGFNGLNQPTSIIEAMGTILDVRVSSVSYDGFGRVLGVANGSDSLNSTYTGPNLTKATRIIGGVTVTQDFGHDPSTGQLKSEKTTQPGLSSIINYGYDSLGRLQTLTYPEGRLIGYGYDALSRVNSITNNTVTLVSNIKYDDWGNRWQSSFASGAQDQWDADPSGTRLKTWSIGFVGGGPDSRSYTYDDATNILKTAGEWTLTPDPNTGRLKEADGFGIKTAHEYDAFGNAISHLATPDPSAVPPGVVPPAFNNFTFNPLPNNQIPGSEKNGALTGWNTNMRGEATQVGTATSSGVALGLTWDGLGLLKSIVWNSGNQGFLYAPSGMRVSLVDTVTTANSRKYAYSNNGLLLGEYLSATGTPSWNRDVVYLGSEAIAEIDASGVHELHNDHLGTPRLITKGKGTWASNVVGTVEATQAYGPYGELLSRIGTYVPLTGYTGHIQTDDSGLIYMRGRFYSPAWHAFVNSDQGVDPNSWNQTAYVGGSPFMFSDPTGMRHVDKGVTARKNGQRYECMAEGGCDTESDGGWVLSGTVSVIDNAAGPFDTTRIDPGMNPGLPESLSGFGGSAQGGGTTSPQTPKPTLDCEKLKKLGIKKQDLDRMKSTMAASGYGASQAEMGYSYDPYRNQYIPGVATSDPTTGRPMIDLTTLSGRSRGYTFHVHPNGYSPFPSSDLDGGIANKWTGGQHFVGSSSMLVNYNSINLAGNTIGSGNWWEVNCP